MSEYNSQVVLKDSLCAVDQSIVDSFGSAELFYKQFALIVCEKEVIIDYIAEIKAIMLSFEENSYH